VNTAKVTWRRIQPNITTTKSYICNILVFSTRTPKLSSLTDFCLRVRVSFLAVSVQTTVTHLHSCPCLVSSYVWLSGGWTNPVYVLSHHGKVKMFVRIRNIEDFYDLEKPGVFGVPNDFFETLLFKTRRTYSVPRKLGWVGYVLMVCEWASGLKFTFQDEAVPLWLE
jgi:hypothetical protein